MSARREFYSFLKGEFISEKNNLHAVSLWNEFEMRQWVIIMIFIS